MQKQKAADLPVIVNKAPIKGVVVQQKRQQTTDQADTVHPWSGHLTVAPWLVASLSSPPPAGRTPPQLATTTTTTLIHPYCSQTDTWCCSVWYSVMMWASYWVLCGYDAAVIYVWRARPSRRTLREYWRSKARRRSALAAPHKRAHCPHGTSRRLLRRLEPSRWCRRKRQRNLQNFINRIFLNYQIYFFFIAFTRVYISCPFNSKCTTKVQLH